MLKIENVDIYGFKTAIRGARNAKNSWNRSYNQRRTVLLNYAVLRNIYHSGRKTHKLDCWRAFCAWIETLPHAYLITGGGTDDI